MHVVDGTFLTWAFKTFLHVGVFDHDESTLSVWHGLFALG